MKKICLAAVSGAALLGLASLANAQGAGTGTGAGTGAATSSASNQCWDVSTNMARDKSAGGAASGSTTAGGTTTGAAGTGSAGTVSPGSGAAGGAGSASGSASAAARPAGMPTSNKNVTRTEGHHSNGEPFLGSHHGPIRS